MLFLIPAGIAIFKGITVAKVITVAAIGVTAAITAKTMHDAGRRKGLAEGKAAHATELQAMRDRLDEMEYEE